MLGVNVGAVLEGVVRRELTVSFEAQIHPENDFLVDIVVGDVTFSRKVDRDREGRKGEDGYVLGH